MVINGHQPFLKSDIRLTLLLAVTAEGSILPFKNRAVIFFRILVNLRLHELPSQRHYAIELRYRAVFSIFQHCPEQSSLVRIRQHFERPHHVEIDHNSGSCHSTSPHFSQAVISMCLGTALVTLFRKCPSWLVASERCSKWISLHWLRSRLRR